MNKLTLMKYPVTLLPAFAMGISMAAANDIKCNCPCDHEQASVSAEQNHSQNGAEKATMASADASSNAKIHAGTDASAIESHYLANRPADNYFSGNLIGHDVMNRRDNEVVGTVNELLIDRDGQIGAVIISTGGIMGIGKKDLAVAWDQVERKIDGDDITLSVDFSNVSLVEAPIFARK